MKAATGMQRIGWRPNFSLSQHSWNRFCRIVPAPGGGRYRARARHHRLGRGESDRPGVLGCVRGRDVPCRGARAAAVDFAHQRVAQMPAMTPP